MAANPTNMSSPERQDFIVRLTSMYHEAHRLGFFSTGHKLHEAVREVGYEAARIINKTQSPPDLFTVPDKLLHRPGQTTSAAALTKTKHARTDRQRRVFDALDLCGRYGAIPEELAKKMGEDLIDVRRCFSVLKKLGKIEANHSLRTNEKGNECEVMVTDRWHPKHI